ncbi:hypothetical protein GCM10010195_47640 [Kitasatospora griseola]|nr:hypothetical protein GCM10010195_47640 [Kitasatospora griseola]
MSPWSDSSDFFGPDSPAGSGSGRNPAGALSGRGEAASFDGVLGREPGGVSNGVSNGLCADDVAVCAGPPWFDCDGTCGGAGGADGGTL